jgi:catechol 2,3-dioxygenase-like lactoylglutathione lyase family enzyme
MDLDHIVIWVEDPARSVTFFVDVVGLTAVRLDDWRAGAAPYPSVRISATTIMDVIPLATAADVNKLPGAAGTAGNKTNHICLAMPRTEFDALRARLEAAGTRAGHFTTDAFGARGLAPRAFYFRDPDGNIFEARHYD